MTDDPVHPVTVETNGKSEHVVVTEPNTADDFYVFRRRFVHVVLLGFIASILLGGASFFLIQKESSDSITNLTEDVHDLRSDLSDAEREIDATQSKNQELVSCRAAYNNAVSEASSLVLTELAQLIVLVAAEPSDPAALTIGIEEISMAGAQLDQAIADRAAFEDGGAILPCPIELP